MKQKVEETTTDLLDFNWEGDGVDFFNIKEGTTEPTVKEKEIISKTDKTEKEVDEEETEDTSEKLDEFFEETSEEEKEEDKEKIETSSGKDEDYWQDVYKDFKEVGLFKHVEPEEGEEISSERLFEMQQEEYEAEVSARLTSWATEELDEDAKEFIKFKRNGGITSEFFDTYANSSNLPSGDISEEEYQDKVIRYQLKEEGWDSDEVEDRLKYLTDNGGKEKIAKRYDKKIKTVETQQKNQILKQAEETKKVQQKQEQTFKDNIKSVLLETDDVNGFKITPIDKTKLYSFLTKKQYKISESKSITGFQKKLGEVFQDTNKMILLAKLVNNDFNMENFEKSTVTKTTRKIKSNLEQRQNLRPNNSGSSLKGGSLAELF